MNVRGISELPPLGRPVYIQTYLPTAQHIRKNSVLAIEKLEDLVSNRLGVTAWENSCEFCDNFMEDCPGHDGHLEIPIPIYRIFFVRRLISILNSICFYCQRLRMPKTDKNYEWIRSLPRKQRLKKLEKLSALYKTCGHGTPTACFTPSSYHQTPSLELKEPCRKPFVIFRKEDKDNAFIRAVIPLDDADHSAYVADPLHWRPMAIGPQDIYDCLCLLDEETQHMLGCDEWNAPSALMWEVLPIPCLNTRPSHTFAGLGAGKKRAFNDWTKYLREIVSSRNELRTVMQLSSERVTCCHYVVHGIEHRDFTQCFRYGYMDRADREKVKKRFKSELKQGNFGAIEAAWRAVNKNVAAFHSHKHRKYIQKAAYGKPLVNVEERYKYQRNGRFRGNVISRRTKKSGRGVLEASITQEVDQAGIPRRECMNLSVRINVSRYNMAEAQKWILNGPHVYPGANYVTLKDGREINLSFMDNRRLIDLSEVLFVERHLLDNDIVIVNRQPTLHRPSMMSFRVQVIEGFCVRLHYAVFPPLGADCDGDEVNFQVIEGLEAQAEARQISSVANSIMKDGKIWIQFILNAVIGAHLLTRADVRLNQSDVHFILSAFLLEADFVWPEPCEHVAPGYTHDGDFDHGRRWSGHQLVSSILPPELTLITKDLVIRNGIMESGQLNEKLLNGSNGILHHLYRDVPDRNVTLRFLYRGYIVFQRYLDLFGHSVGYYDCAIDFQHEDAYAQGAYDTPQRSDFHQIMQRVARMQDQVIQLNTYSDSLVGHTPDSPDEETERNVLKHIQQLTSLGTNLALDYQNYVNQHFQQNENGLLHMIRSGAKGSDLTLNQMAMMVGEIAVMYRRFPHVSSHFRKGKDTATMYGFIHQAYARGVPLSALIAEAPSTCESAVTKNKGTSKAGYIIRKQTSCMMGVVVDYLNRTIDTHDRIIWTVYGNDGYDPQCLLTVKVPLDEQPYDRPWVRTLRQQVKQLFSRCLDALKPTDTRAPLDMEHLLHRCVNLPGIGSAGAAVSHRDYETFTDCLWQKLLQDRLVVDTNLTLKLLVFHWLSPYELDQRRLGLGALRWLAEQIRSLLVRAVVQPGEAVGINATQNMGEPYAQMTLKTPHFSGKFTTVVAGTTRISNLVDGNFCNPQMTIVLKPTVTTLTQAHTFGLLLNRCHLKNLLLDYPSYTLEGGDPTSDHEDEEDPSETRVCHIQMPLDRDKCMARLISLRGVVRNLSRSTGLSLPHFTVPFMDGPERRLVLRIRVPLSSKFWNMMAENVHVKTAPEALVADNVLFNLCHSIVVHGLASVENFVTEEVKIDGETQPRWVITTLGSNLRQVLRMPQVDSQRTVSNDVTEMCKVFGIHAARKSLEHEFMQVLSGKADARHIKLVSRVMASDLVIKGMKIKQVAQSIPPLQRAAYERGPEQMVEYCSVAEQDHGKTICGAVLMNKTLACGTGFNLTLKPLPEALVPEVYRQQYDQIPQHIKSYVFSPKPDGVRYFLVFFHNRQTPPARIAVLVDRTHTLYELPADDLPERLFAGTVLDGELTQVGPRQYVFLAFDCLMSYGNKTSVLRYDHRIELAREVVFRMNNNRYEGRRPLPMGAHLPYALPIALRPETSHLALPAGQLPFLLAVKPIFDLSGLADYHRRIQQPGALPFAYDGLVFTDLRDPAYPFRLRPTSVLKWKPRMADFSENTIDFMVTARTGPENVLQDWVPKFRPADPRIAAFRRFDPQQTNVWLWSMLPDKSAFCFSGGCSELQSFVPNRIYECRWNYRLQNWEVVRWRNKDLNMWETVILTVQNIIEDIQFEELL